VTFMHPPARHSSRLGQRFQVALGAAAALAAISLSPGSAQAYVVTVGGTQYDVTTFTGTFIANSSKFALPPAPGVMPWFENPTLIDSFATAVGTNLGMNNILAGTTRGPLFAQQTTGSSYSWCTQGCTSNPSVDFFFYNPGISYVWAQATLYTPPAASVPGPLPLLGAGAAFGFSRKLRKRIQVARKPQVSNLPLA